MSAKNLDPKGRLRSETIAYRCSPAERKELDKRWKLLGYATKQDYVLDSVLHNKVTAKGNPMMLVNFRKELYGILEELERLEAASEIDEELFTPIRTMLEILEAFKENEDKNKKNKIRRKDKFWKGEHIEMCKVIICANQKGGVAKSTSVVNLGIGLANKGKRVLVIDNDPQGSLTEALGYPQPDKLEITLANVMEWVLNEDDYDLKAGILHHKEGIDLMPANIELSGVETSLVGIMSSETTLREYIESVRDDYDYILVDCSPNLGQLTLNALVAADEVIIPVQAAYLPIKGLEQLLKTISRVKRKMNPKLHIMGILITMVDYRTIYAKEITEVLYEHYGSSIHIFDDVIPLSVRAAEASAEGVSIYKYDGKGKVAAAYEKIVEEVLANEQ